MNKFTCQVVVEHGNVTVVVSRTMSEWLKHSNTKIVGLGLYDKFNNHSINCKLPPKIHEIQPENQ